MGKGAEGGDRELAELMGKLEDPAFFARIGAGLPPSTAARVDTGADAASLAPSIRALGWGALHGMLGSEEARRLVDVIDALGREGVPPLFVYAFEATWHVGARIARAISTALGADYEVLADAWAFRVAPGPDHAGWSPHRGSYELARDRSAPDLLNVWVALTDATVDNACMHVVPLDDDPGYPDDLRSHDAAERATPLPVPAGTALVWNANVLHSGGRSTERAKGPRISITFTLRRRDRADTVAATTSAVDLSHLDDRARLDLLADQIRAYGAMDGTLPDAVRRWAELTTNLRSGSSFRASDPLRKAP